jgi:hypothetical protein
MKKSILLITLLWLFLACVNNLSTGTSDSMGGTSDETIVRTGATIYEQDGTTPARDAIVKVFRADAIDGKFVTLQRTDSDGQYCLQNLGPGIFNIWVEKDSMVAFQDSIYISGSGSTLHNDTLDCASSLTGFTCLQPLYDPRSVTIQVIGTDIHLNHIDSTGHFTLKGMAGGKYSLLLKSNLTDYSPTTQMVKVHNCTNDTLKDTIRVVDSEMISRITTLYAASIGTVQKKTSLSTIQLNRNLYGNCDNSLYHTRHSSIGMNGNILTSTLMEEYQKFP